MRGAMGRTVEVATGIRIFFGGAPGGVGSGGGEGRWCVVSWWVCTVKR